MTASTDATLTVVPVTMTLTPPTDGMTVMLPKDYDVTIGAPNTIIVYQMSNDTPASLKFAGVTIAPNSGNGEFSAPSISPDGRMLTLIDFCSYEETFKVSFICTNSDGSTYIFDPQVQNVPH